jgi:hypothetical protein
MTRLLKRCGVIRATLAIASLGLAHSALQPVRAGQRSVPSSHVAQRKLPITPQIAQLFYPPVDPNPVVRVIGKGQASLSADHAELSFEFSSPSQEGDSVEPTALKFHPTFVAVTETDLKAILKALEAVGVRTTQIQIRFDDTPASSPLPFPLPFPSKGGASDAKIRVQQEKPTQAKLSKIVNAVQSKVDSLKNLALSRVSVNYAVKDCQALESAVYQSAMRSAQNRAKAIASAMGATLNPVPSVAQPFYELFIPGCGTSPAFPFSNSGSDYDPQRPPEVSLSREIFVTYTLKP